MSLVDGSHSFELMSCFVPRQPELKFVKTYENLQPRLLIANHQTGGYDLAPPNDIHQTIYNTMLSCRWKQDRQYQRASVDVEASYDNFKIQGGISVRTGELIMKEPISSNLNDDNKIPEIALAKQASSRSSSDTMKDNASKLRERKRFQRQRRRLTTQLPVGHNNNESSI